MKEIPISDITTTEIKERIECLKTAKHLGKWGQERLAELKNEARLRGLKI